MAAPLWRLVAALGIAQIISWGALYYAIGVLGAPMRAELRISEATLFGAYSLSLLLSGLVAPAAGRAIDRWGGRVVMSAGSIIAALALLTIGEARNVIALYVAWAMAGVAMALTLYEPAFATLSQHTGISYRKALTALTLLGGLASTIFWPASLAGLEWLGWRHTMVAFGLLQIAVCLPLHLTCVPRSRRDGLEQISNEVGSIVARAVPSMSSIQSPPFAQPVVAVTADGAARHAFVALAAAFALHGFVVSGLAVHLISVLEGKHFTLANAVWVASFIGPMQVAGRIAEFSIGGRFPSCAIGAVAFAGMAIAVVLLAVLDGDVGLALAFSVLYGASNGVITIVRGMVPAELFGRIDFGKTLGKLAAPSLAARALAPLACAGLATPGAASFGWLVALALLSLLALVAFGLAFTGRHARRSQKSTH